MIKKKNLNTTIPSIAIEDGKVNMTQIFKALAMAMHFTYGAPMARAPFTAAMKAKFFGEKIKKSEMPSSI